MRALLALLLTLLFPRAASTEPRYLSPLVRFQYETAVKVSIECTPFGEKKRAGAVDMGSGVVVGPRHVMTARHVVSCDEDDFDRVPPKARPTKVVVTTRAGAKLEAKVVMMGLTFGQDAALLAVVRAGPRPFAAWPCLADEMPAIGEPICVASGLPMRTLACGPVQDYLDHTETDREGDWGALHYFSYDANTTYGTSGSGVWDARGRLVGINVGHLHNKWMRIGYEVGAWRYMVRSVVPRGCGAP